MRSEQEEWLDDLDISGQQLEQNLSELERINDFLGGDKVLLDAFKQLESEPMTVLDVGCGSAGGLRKLEREFGDHKYYGIDANKNVVDYALSKLSQDSPIKISLANCFDEQVYKNIAPNVIICSLFMHHFSYDEIERLLNLFKKYAHLIIINDLHRNVFAYLGFKIVTFLFKASSMTKHDGALSIKKGFRKNEWQKMLENVSGIEYEIKWKWAFRHQIIIKVK